MHQEGLLVLVHADGKSHVDPMVSPSPRHPGRGASGQAEGPLVELRVGGLCLPVTSSDGLHLVGCY